MASLEVGRSEDRASHRENDQVCRGIRDGATRFGYLESGVQRSLPGFHCPPLPSSGICGLDTTRYWKICLVRYPYNPGDDVMCTRHHLLRTSATYFGNGVSTGSGE